MGINYQSAGNRLNNAMRLFEMASATGKYKTYENALYAFDVAIASGHDVAKAKKGKKDAQLAYAREAMFRHDFDLALDLVEPLVAGSREAQKLMGRIVDKRAADRLSRRRVNLLYPVLLAAAVFLVVVVVNVRRYYLERAEENGGLVAGMTEKLNRSAELHAGVGIQTQYTVIYQDLVFRRADLGRCAGYQPLFDFLTSIYDEMLNAQSGQEGTRRDVYRRLAANAPLFKALREDLMSEGDPYVRGKNADLENRLADMEGLLAEYRF